MNYPTRLPFKVCDVDFKGVLSHLDAQRQGGFVVNRAGSVKTG
tara:strand:+ start:1338 stop:1466 length:129 start_codon:yes stop_codon:yes gene_type:complete